MRVTELRAVPYPVVEKGLAAWAHRQYISMSGHPGKRLSLAQSEGHSLDLIGTEMVGERKDFLGSCQPRISAL